MLSFKIDQGSVETVSVFQKLKALYETFFDFSVFIVYVSIGFLLLLEVDGRVAVAPGVARYMFCSSVITGVVSCVVTQMVMFYFEEVDIVEGFESVVAWLPVVVCDFSFLQFAIGLCYFVLDRSSVDLWRVFVRYTAALLGCCVTFSLWMFYTLRVKASSRAISI